MQPLHSIQTPRRRCHPVLVRPSPLGVRRLQGETEMRKRSSYKPRPVLRDCMAYIKQGFAPVRDQQEITTLRMKNHASLEEIVKGRANKKHMDVLIVALNMTEALTMVRADLGADWKTEIRAAQDALFNMAQRGATSGRFVFTGPELTAINLLMELHDQQLDVCTVDELQQAIELSKKIIRSGGARVIQEKKEIA